MTLLIQAAPLLPGRVDAYERWIEQVRARRVDHERSRLSKGIRREMQWLLSTGDADLVLVALETKDEGDDVQAFARSDDPYDRWFREQVAELLGPEVAEGRATPSELLLDRVRSRREVPLIVPYVAVANRVRPGLSDELRRRRRGVDPHADHLDEYLEVLGLERLSMWLQPTAVGDYVVYYAEGDVALATEVLATSEHPCILQDRSFAAEFFGLDVAVETYAVPLPSFAWSEAPSL